MKYFILFACCLNASTSTACINCNKQLQREIYNSTFYPNLFYMLSGFLVLALIVIILTVISSRYYSRNRSGFENPVPLATASIVLGIGLGGFADGIVLHQILQWHEMLSNKIPTDTVQGKSVNMFWDGVFHGFCFIVVFTGIVLLWSLLRRTAVNYSGKLLTGGLLMGWGIFNLVEGVIDHHVLRLHNVREVTVSPEGWNYGFLLASTVLLVAGVAIVYKGSQGRPIDGPQPIEKD